MEHGLVSFCTNQNGIYINNNNGEAPCTRSARNTTDKSLQKQCATEKRAPAKQTK